MRTLYLIRHAKSSWDHPGVRDFNRPLNDRGLHDAPRMAQHLAREGVRPDLLVSSPAKRALTTALFFADIFDIPDDQVAQNEAIYEAAPAEILRIVRELPGTARTVLLFGHNPALTEVANRFSDTFIANMPTCGIVRIESSAPDWSALTEHNSQVRAYFFPKEIL